MTTEPWADPDNGGTDDWETRPKALPPGRGEAMRIPVGSGPVKVLNGCPKCHGEALLRRSDRARHCKACDLTFYVTDVDWIFDEAA